MGPYSDHGRREQAARHGGGAPPPERSGPRYAIVSSADIEAEPGHPLSADFWVNRKPGETWTAYRMRCQIEEVERRIAKHEEAAAKLRDELARLRALEEQ